MLPAGRGANLGEAHPERPHADAVPGVGHFAMQEDPKTVTAIGDFLAA